MGDIDEETALQTRVRLLATRDRWNYDASDRYVYVAQRGGGWTQKHKGHVTDVATCFCRASAKAFCIKHQRPRQKGFTFTAYGGEENCNMLAREWASKGGYFVRLFLDAGKADDFIFSEEMLSSSLPTEEWLEWAISLDNESE